MNFHSQSASAAYAYGSEDPSLKVVPEVVTVYVTAVGHLSPSPVASSWIGAFTVSQEAPESNDKPADFTLFRAVMSKFDS
jgi:hypothetical protein